MRIIIKSFLTGLISFFLCSTHAIGQECDLPEEIFICPGSNVQIGLYTAESGPWDISLGGSVICNGCNNIPHPVAEGTYELSNGSCTSEVAVGIIELDLSINNTCSSSSMTVQSGLDTDVLTYDWDISSGGINSNGNGSGTLTGGFIGTETQNVDIDLTVSDPITNCSVAASINVDILEHPNIALFLNGDGGEICQEGPVDLGVADLSSTSCEDCDYEIDWGDQSEPWTEDTPPLSSVQHTYQDGIYSLTYSVTTDDGCTSSISYDVTVLPNITGSYGPADGSSFCIDPTTGFVEVCFDLDNIGQNTAEVLYNFYPYGEDVTDSLISLAPPLGQDNFEFCHDYTEPSCLLGEEGDWIPYIEIIYSTEQCEDVKTGTEITIKGPASAALTAQNPYCFGDPVTVNNLSTGATGNCNPNTPNTLNWSIDDGADSSTETVLSSNLNGDTFTYNFASSGEHTIALDISEFTLDDDPVCPGGSSDEVEICIMDPADGTTDWNGHTSGDLLCLDDDDQVSFSPSFTLSEDVFLCDSMPIYTWTVTQAEDCGSGCISSSSEDCHEITGEDTSNPTIEFFCDCSYTISLSVLTCGDPFEESLSIQVQSLPQIEIDGCLEYSEGDEVNLGDLITVQACATELDDLSYEYNGQTLGSVASPDVSITLIDGEPLIINGENSCGASDSTLSFNLSDVSLCPVDFEEDACADYEFDPTVNDDDACTWYISENGGPFEMTAVPFTPLPNISYSAYADCTLDSDCPCTTETINLPEVPEVVQEILIDNPTPCEGEEITLSISPPPLSYSWEDYPGNDNTPLSLIATPGISTVEANIIYDSACPDSLISVEFTSQESPLSMDCSSIPNPICDNGDPIPFPVISSTDDSWLEEDGEWLIVDLNNPIDSIAVVEINPEDLGIGNYRLVYLWNNPSGCEFEVNCDFDIDQPQPLEIIEPIGPLCENLIVDLDLAVDYPDILWESAPCTAIDSTSGIIDLDECADLIVNISVSGNCLITDEISLDLIPLPGLEAGSDEDICFNECVELQAEILEGEESLEWTFSNATLTNDIFCPSDLGLNASDSYWVVATAAEENGCVVSDSLQITVLGLPDFGQLPDSLCSGEEFVLPACTECTGGSITLDGPVNSEYPFPLLTPIQLTDPGDYTYELTGNLDDCSVTLDGMVHVISLPQVEIFQPNYDDCDLNYTVVVEASGEDSLITWNNPMIDPSIQVVDDGSLEYTITYPNDFEVNQVFEEQIVISNSCGADSASIISEFTALPGFSVDNDSLVCSASDIIFRVDLLFPVDVNSFTVSSDYPGFTPVSINGFPPDSLSYVLETNNSPQTYTFTFTAFNHCGEVVVNSQVTVYPADLVFDMVLDYELPLCPGDSIQAELVEEFGQVGDLSFNNLEESPVNLISDIDNDFIFQVKEEVEDGNYDISSFMVSPLCPPIVDVDPIIIGPTFPTNISNLIACPEDTIRMDNDSFIQGAEYFWESNGASPAQYSTELSPSFYFPRAGDFDIYLNTTHPDYCPSSDTAEVFISSDEFIERITNLPSEIEPTDPYAEFEVVSNIALQDVRWYNPLGIEVGFGEEALLHVPVESCQNTSLTAVATSVFGCVQEKTHIVGSKANRLFIPNAFTPDGDGLNDVWIIQSTAPLFEYHLWIYDRWGELIHEIDCESEKSCPEDPIWIGNIDNGKHYAQPGVYNWVIEYTCNDRIKEKGHVVLIR